MRQRRAFIMCRKRERKEAADFLLTKGHLRGYNTQYRAGVVQRLVHQPSKLRTRVRLPSPAPDQKSSRMAGLFLLQIIMKRESSGYARAFFAYLPKCHIGIKQFQKICPIDNGFCAFPEKRKTQEKYLIKLR